VTESTTATTADVKAARAEALSIRALVVTLVATNAWFFTQAMHYAS